MSRALACLWSLVILVSATILFATSSRAAKAHAAARDARQDLNAVGDQAADLLRLRQARTEVPDRPEGGLASKISGAMARAGLASTIMQSLSPEAQSAVAGQTAVMRQRATLTLAGLSLPQVGKFLDAWRSAEPDWIVSGIDLTPINSKDVPSIGTDLPLRAVITIEGLFRERPKPGASR